MFNTGSVGQKLNFMAPIIDACRKLRGTIGLAIDSHDIVILVPLNFFFAVWMLIFG